MNKFELMEKVAEKFDLDFEYDPKEYARLTFYSPAGQDMYYEMDVNEDFEDVLNEFVDGFDVDYETYIWLDNFGHGKNGAPYHIRDILEDSEYILDLLESIRDEYVASVNLLQKK